MIIGLSHNNAIKKVAGVILIILCLFPIVEARKAQMSKSLSNVGQAQQVVSDDTVKVSLVTCFPGPEIYELCGHEAIRVQTPTTDSVWNFGLFDFNEPNFVYRFVKGETDYHLGGYPFAWFLPEYLHRGSKVVEQDLNLTPQQAIALRKMLQTEGLPQNNTYRYNYIKDNCSTRIISRLDSVAAGNIIFPEENRFETWRDAMRHYHANYPWYQFGIDLALGSGLDAEMTGRDDMFVPMMLMQRARNAHFGDGRPLVKAERVLTEGREDAILPPTSPYLTPMSLSIAALIICIIFSAVSIVKKRLWKWGYAIWFGMLGITGCLSAFLVFVSSHEATSPNLLILWLNPLQLIFPLFIWWHKGRILCKSMSIVDCVVLLSLLVIWPMQPQSANPAFFPLMIATLIMSISYAILSFHPSYNKWEDDDSHYGMRASSKRTKGRQGALNFSARGKSNRSRK
ncbi:MAG: DUF4105 domain-containing protein [Prevotella sp.]|nr:DUF4105 domain-containing protein [Bacteroides sp.]MCM1366033.1 DUF4105 domain-containing protein [Prevotella sp.]MCM1436897.1 DUF4105 domain-containing protein [Prevotella sp.]